MEIWAIEEVGHNVIGAGRIFDQGAKLVDIMNSGFGFRKRHLALVDERGAEGVQHLAPDWSFERWQCAQS